MFPTAQSLARTYSDREYADPWEKVLDYQRVQEYIAEHPKQGRVRVGNNLDLPPNRVRAWINGGMPDSIRGIQSAIDHGWLDPDPTSGIAGRLVKLLAHILAGGSITTDTFVPAVTVGRRVDLDTIQEAFNSVDVKTNIRNDGVNGRAAEVFPANDASVLGRCLTIMGAPAGGKADLEAFPPIIFEAPLDIQKSVAQIYVAHRAIEYPQKDTMVIREKRSESYLEGLKKLLTHVTGESVTTGDQTVTISADAARVLNTI